MRVVVDATPLIALSLVDRLELLHRLFEEVFVPPAVYEEITAKDVGRAGIGALHSADWIKVVPIKTVPTIEPLLLGLDEGELQVLLLAREVAPDWVLMDERLGRRVAQALGFPVKGTVGVILASFHCGYISKPEALEIVSQMVGEGIRISTRVIDWLVGELNLDEVVKS
jgi:predicted nucleic acid-binding protein